MTIFGGFITGGTVSTDPGDATKLTFSGIVINGALGAVAGDTFSAGGYQVPIVSIDGTGAATLVYPFPDALDGETDYAITRDSADRYNPAATNLLVRQYLAKIADASIAYVVPDAEEAPTELIAPDPQEGQKAIQFGTQWKVWLFTGGAWELQNGYVGGSGIKVDASGLLSERGSFDAEEPGFTYFGSDTNLLYVRLNAGGWSSGSQIIGLDGAPGAPGAPGERGPAGPTTIAVGSVTTLAPGVSATVTNSGDEEDAILDFGIPSGEKGDKGDQGIQGIQGEKGDKGDQGIQGIQGEPGRDGTGAGDMVAAVYDPSGKSSDAFNQDNMADGAVNKNYTATEKAKLAGLGSAAEKDVGTSAGNVPLLDGSGVLPTSTLPAIAITDTFEVSSESAMLALSAAEQGDVAIRSDINKSFILKQTPYSTLANWVELKTPTDAVLSVAGRTGAVTLAKNDVGLGNVDNTSDVNKPVSTAQATAIAAKVDKTSITISASDPSGGADGDLWFKVS